AAMVDNRHQGTFPVPVAVVDDTRLGLGRLAAGWRGRFAPALVAVTGSEGKNPGEGVLAPLPRAHARARPGPSDTRQPNNDIGLPLTLLRLREQHRCCAIELGMNHKGEIAYLARIARPGVALVNNAQREHLEFMNSIEEVAAENASVYGALPADGVAVVNAEDSQPAS